MGNTISYTGVRVTDLIFDLRVRVTRVLSQNYAVTTRENDHRSVESAILARERLPLLTKSQPTDVLVDYFPPRDFFVLTTALSSGGPPLLRTVVRTKKSLEESSQRAHSSVG